MSGYFNDEFLDSVFDFVNGVSSLADGFDLMSSQDALEYFSGLCEFNMAINDCILSGYADDDMYLNTFNYLYGSSLKDVNCYYPPLAKIFDEKVWPLVAVHEVDFCGIPQCFYDTEFPFWVEDDLVDLMYEKGLISS